jgi:hypothetical protein
MQPFSVLLSGSFHSFNLYDAHGREITEMMAAADFAESEFGADWAEVFNGSEGIDRDEYTQLRGSPCLR